MEGKVNVRRNGGREGRDGVTSQGNGVGGGKARSKRQEERREKLRSRRNGERK